MTSWNPNAPNTAGMEWFPTRQLSKALSAAACVGCKVASSATETLATIHAFLEATGVTQVGLDIYDATNVYANDTFGALAIPAADVADSGGWEQSVAAVDSGAWHPYQYLGSHGYNVVKAIVADHYTGADLINAETNKVRFQPTSGQPTGAVVWQQAAATYVDASSGSGSVDPSASRVGKVQITCVARNAGTKNGVLDGWLGVSGTRFGSDSGPVTLPAGNAFAKYVFEYDWDPSSGLPWFNADLAAFFSGGANDFGVTVSGSVGTDIVICGVNLVFRVMTERRLATANGSTPSAFSSASWVPFTLQDPTDGTTATWAKANSTSYLIVFWLTKSGGFCKLNGLDDTSINGAGLTGWQGADVAVAQTLIPNAAPVYNVWVPTLFMAKSDLSIGADAQPYALCPPVPVDTTVAQTSQQLAAHSTAAYAGATFLLALPPVAPDGSLVVRIHKTSDDSQVGGDITIAAGSVVYNASGFALLTVPMASAASLTSGTSYYLRWTSAASARKSWMVQLLETDSVTSTDGTTAAGGGIGGTTIVGGVTNGQADLPSNVHTAPTAPASLAASVGTKVPAVVSPGGPTTIKYAHLVWAATSLGGSFGHYELQRQDAGVWNTIAVVTDESKVAFNDIEVLRGVAQSYQVRVVRSDGAPSAWTA